MNRKYFFLLLIPIFLLALFEGAKPLAASQLKNQLRKTFPASTVTVSRCEWAPMGSLVFYGITVQKDKSLEVKIPDIRAFYTIERLTRGKVAQVLIHDPEIRINLPSKNFNTVNSLVSFPKNDPAGPTITIESLKIDNLKLSVKSKDLKLNATVSAELEPVTQKVNALQLQADSLEFGAAKVRNVSFNVSRSDPGEAKIESIKVQKLEISNVRSPLRLEGKNFRADHIDGEVHGGKISGDLVFELSPDVQYHFNVQVSKLDVAQLIEDLDLKKKFSMSGLMSGQVSLAGQGADLKLLDGNLSMDEKGGVFVIHDTKMLENLSRSTGQGMDLLVDSFKDYNYNTGVLKLSLDKGNVMLALALDGKTGKRDLSVIFHDLY